MTDKNLTDNEIKKALECCVSKGYPQGCDDCPYRGLDCNERLDADALDLINKLEAENERLSRITRNLVGEIKAEAYTEFAERLKKKYKLYVVLGSGVAEIEIDDLLKELVGEDNESKN